MSPTQRTLKLLRDEGYLAAVVERWNPHARIRQDLFGFVDVLAIHPETGDTLAVQSTSYTNASRRIRKIEEHENLPAVRAAGWRIEVQGWRKVKNRWTCRRVDMS